MFLLHLARTVFHVSVELLEQHLSSREFQEWLELYAIEPWGDDWEQASLVAVTNLHPWSKKKRRRDEFVPRSKAARYPDTKSVEIKMLAWATQHNAAIAAKKE